MCALTKYVGDWHDGDCLVPCHRVRHLCRFPLVGLHRGQAFYRSRDIQQFVLSVRSPFRRLGSPHSGSACILLLPAPCTAILAIMAVVETGEGGLAKVVLSSEGGAGAASAEVYRCAAGRTRSRRRGHLHQSFPSKETCGLGLSLPVGCLREEEGSPGSAASPSSCSWRGPALPAVARQHNPPRTPCPPAGRHGATLTGWSVGGEQLIFVSPKAVFQPPKAIRGGVPVCFPQFGNLGPLQVGTRVARCGSGRAAAHAWGRACCTPGPAAAVLLRMAALRPGMVGWGGVPPAGCVPRLPCTPSRSSVHRRPSTALPATASGSWRPAAAAAAPPLCCSLTSRRWRCGRMPSGQSSR